MKKYALVSSVITFGLTLALKLGTSITSFILFGEPTYPTEN